MCTRITVKDCAIPAAFSGMRIALLSDLHGKWFGRGQRRILDLLAGAHPDLVALTGDLIDDDHLNGEAAMALVRGATAIAPSVFVPGNHEAQLPGEYSRLRRRMEGAGCRVLGNESMTLCRDSGRIQIVGIKDPEFVADTNRMISGLIAGQFLRIAQRGCEGASYRILLAHRPELVATYNRAGMDLVLSGHAHGGQWRVGSQGVFAPGQGLLPLFTGGLYRIGDTSLVVSRGLGNIFPVRINNRPEVVLITLETLAT